MLTRAGRVAALSLSSCHPPLPRNQGCIGLHVSTSTLLRVAGPSASSTQTRSVTTKNPILRRRRERTKLEKRVIEEGLGNRGGYVEGEGPNSELLAALVQGEYE